MPFLPITREDALQRGWDELDVIFVTGDAYIDHPSFGVPLLARWLESHGFRVGIIPQPDWRSKEPFMALGRPRLFFAVSAGSMDSMVAHYTAARKLRRDDAYTPGNRHGARPNRATIIYTSRLKEAFKDVPVVIGGIEASLRRYAHYDYWDNKVRRSVLFDAKADLLVYGMGERPLLEMAQRMHQGETIDSVRDVRGTAYATSKSVMPGPSGWHTDEDTAGCIEIPSFEEVVADKRAYAAAFCIVSRESSHHATRTVVQRHGGRLLACNPPSIPLRESELDAVYAQPFTRLPHSSYRETIPAYEQIKSSITSHRGCFGGCAFCAITHHQGKNIQSRSERSILSEVEVLAAQPWFRGSITDVGGPTANMYGSECGSASAGAACRRESCLFPQPCPNLKIADRRGGGLLKAVRTAPGVRNVVVSSGVRYDLLARQPGYLRELLTNHVGGLLKVAPEHLVERVTRVMRKPGSKVFYEFLSQFTEESARLGKKQYIIPYLMSGHPGCTLSDMVDLALALRRARLKVEQVQDFTPTPGTLSTCMYYTEMDPLTGERLYVPRGEQERKLQKALLLSHLPDQRHLVIAALKESGREAAMAELLGAQASADKEPYRTGVKLSPEKLLGAGKKCVARKVKKS